MNQYSIDVMQATPTDKLANYTTAEGKADSLFDFLTENRSLLELPDTIQIHISVIKESRMVEEQIYA